MLSSLVSGLRSRYRRQMQLQTQQMEPHIRTQLVEYVQDNLIIEDDDDDDGNDNNNNDDNNNDDDNTGDKKGGTNNDANVDNVHHHLLLDIDTIQNELDVVHENITKLKCKEEFISLRLMKYKQLPQDKLTEQQKQQLVEIETIHSNMVLQIDNLSKRITQLEQQQSLIRMQKEECDDFLQIAHDIEIQRQREREGHHAQQEGEERPSTAPPSSSEIIVTDETMIDNKVGQEENQEDEDGDVELGKVEAEEAEEEIAVDVDVVDQDSRDEINSNSDNNNKNAATAVVASDGGDATAAATDVGGDGEVGDDYVDIEEK